MGMVEADNASANSCSFIKGDAGIVPPGSGRVQLPKPNSLVETAQSQRKAAIDSYKETSAHRRPHASHPAAIRQESHDTSVFNCRNKAESSTRTMDV